MKYHSSLAPLCSCSFTPQDITSVRNFRNEDEISKRHNRNRIPPVMPACKSSPSPSLLFKPCKYSRRCRYLLLHESPSSTFNLKSISLPERGTILELEGRGLVMYLYICDIVLLMKQKMQDGVMREVLLRARCIGGMQKQKWIVGGSV